MRLRALAFASMSLATASCQWLLVTDMRDPIVADDGASDGAVNDAPLAVDGGNPKTDTGTPVPYCAKLDAAYCTTFANETEVATWSQKNQRNDVNDAPLETVGMLDTVAGAPDSPEYAIRMALPAVGAGKDRVFYEQTKLPFVGKSFEVSFDFYWLGSTEGYPAFFSVRMKEGGGQDMLINFDLDQHVMIHHYIVTLGDPSMPLYAATNTRLPQEQWMRVTLRIRDSERSAELLVGDFFSQKFQNVPTEFFAGVTTPQSIVLGLEYADGPRPSPLEFRYDNVVLRALK